MATIKITNLKHSNIPLQNLSQVQWRLIIGGGGVGEGGTGPSGKITDYLFTQKHY